MPVSWSSGLASYPAPPRSAAASDIVGQDGRTNSSAQLGEDCWHLVHELAGQEAHASDS